MRLGPVEAYPARRRSAIQRFAISTDAMQPKPPFTAALARLNQHGDNHAVPPLIKQETQPDQGSETGASKYKLGGHAQDAIELSDSDSDTLQFQGQKTRPIGVVDLEDAPSVSEAIRDEHLVTNINEGGENMFQPDPATQQTVLPNNVDYSLTAPEDEPLAPRVDDAHEYRFLDRDNDYLGSEEPIQKAPVAYMGPQAPFKNGLSLGPSLFAKAGQNGSISADVRGEGIDGHTGTSNLAPGGSINKVQETLSEMGRTLLATKAKPEVEAMQRKASAHSFSGRRPQNTPSHDQKSTYKKASRVIPSAQPAVGHMGPSGLKIGLATLGMADPDILRQLESKQQETLPTEADSTNEDEFIEPFMGFNKSDLKFPKQANRTSAADDFVRGLDSSQTPTTIGSTNQIKRAVTSTPMKVPVNMAECCVADKMLLYMKDQHKTWADIRTTWNWMTGLTYSQGSLQYRYKRMKELLLELNDADVRALARLQSENPVMQLTSPAIHASRKRPHGEPDIADYFERHQQRARAMNAIAGPHEGGQLEKSGGQGHSLFLNAESDDDHPTEKHPRTGGKGLSVETMKKWRADAQNSPTPSDSEKADEDLDYPMVLYQYHVTRLVALNGQYDDQKRRTLLGPYHTLAEANIVAATNTQRPSEEDTISTIGRGAWSYKYAKDDAGMESHTACGKGGSIQAWVSREIVYPEKDIGIPKNAFTTPSWMYIAIIASSKPTEADNAQTMSNVAAGATEKSKKTIIKACTLLKLANKAAGNEWIQLQSADFPKDGDVEIDRVEMEMHLRNDLKKMDHYNEGFDRIHRDPVTGVETHIWVEQVEVEGPRN